MHTRIVQRNIEPRLSCGLFFFLNISPPRTSVFLTGRGRSKGGTAGTRLMHRCHRVLWKHLRAAVAWREPPLHHWCCGGWVRFLLTPERGQMMVRGSGPRFSVNTDALLPWGHRRHFQNLCNRLYRTREKKSTPRFPTWGGCQRFQQDIWVCRLPLPPIKADRCNSH